METCLPRLVFDPDVRERYLRALSKGDLEGLQELNAQAFAALHGLRNQELGALLQEGLQVEEDVLTKDGDVIGIRFKTNPRAFPFLELNKQLGTTADQHRITPKSQGEGRRDESFSALVDFMSSKRGELDE